MSILAKLVVAVDFEYVITYTTKHYFAQLYYCEFVTKPNFLRVHNYINVNFFFFFGYFINTYHVKYKLVVKNQHPEIPK